MLYTRSHTHTAQRRRGQCCASLLQVPSCRYAAVKDPFRTPASEPTPSWEGPALRTHWRAVPPYPLCQPMSKNAFSAAQQPRCIAQAFKPWQFASRACPQRKQPSAAPPALSCTAQLRKRVLDLFRVSVPVEEKAAHCWWGVQLWVQVSMHTYMHTQQHTLVPMPATRCLCCLHGGNALSFGFRLVDSPESLRERPVVLLHYEGLTSQPPFHE